MHTWSALRFAGSKMPSLWLLRRRCIWVFVAAASAIIRAAALVIVAVLPIAPLAKLPLLVEDAALCRGGGTGRQAGRQVGVVGHQRGQGGCATMP